MATERDYEMLSICVTKRCAEQLRKVAAERGRTVESLAESAVEDAAIMSERGR